MALNENSPPNFFRNGFRWLTHVVILRRGEAIASQALFILQAAISGISQPPIKAFSITAVKITIKDTVHTFKEIKPMQRFILATLSAVTLGATLVSSASALKPIEFSAITANETSPQAVNLAQVTGQFVTVEQAKATTGTASVVTENGQTYLVFDNTFSTAMGPDVQVVLYGDDAEVPVNIEGSEYVVVGDLQSFEGGQRYLVDASIDVNTYDAVAIWCREFDVTFGYAPI